MSNIIKNNSTLSILVDDIKYIEKHGVTKSFIEEILKQMIPNIFTHPLIGYYVLDSKYNEGLIAFAPSDEIIEIYLGKLEYWLENSVNIIMKEFNLNEKDTLRAYQVLQIIAHEVEHAYQYLMGEGIIDAPNDIISNAYKDIYNIITSEGNSESKDYYLANFKGLLLERNAQIESFDLIMQCAEYNGRLDIYDAYNNYSNYWAVKGYKGNSDGSICQTYKILKLCDKYLNINYRLQISEEEKIRYGLPISNETRQKLLKRSN